MSVPVLPSSEHDLVTRFLRDQNFLRQMVNDFGSPLHVLFPQIIKDNIEDFQQAYKKHNCQGKIFYAHKSNRSDSILRQVKHEKIGVEVSSLWELLHALEIGFIPAMIIANGPKSQKYLENAILHKVIIGVDNLDELHSIVDFRKSQHIIDKTKVLIRISGFGIHNQSLKFHDSRFGIPLKETEEVFNFLLRYRQDIHLMGFSLHLDTSLDKQKTFALQQIIQLALTAQKLGFNAPIINMGGGFKLNYLKNKSSWDHFLEYLQQSLLSGEEYTWNGYSFGYHIFNAAVRGGGNFYEHFNQFAKGKHLDVLLSQKAELIHERSIGSTLSELMKELYVEPGRALLDHVGLTLARVNFVKQSSMGKTVVGLDINSKLLATEQDILIDPLLLSIHDSNEIVSHEDKAKEYRACEVFFVGNLCLEHDLIFKRKIFLDRTPQKGDIVCFLNTAGYRMDYSESMFIQHDLPQRIAVSFYDDRFKVDLDELYSPM